MDGRNDFCYEAVLSWDFVHRMHKVPGSCRPPRHIPCGWDRKNPSTYKWFSYKPVFPQKNLQTKFDKAMASRILKTYPVIWAIAASCLAAPPCLPIRALGEAICLSKTDRTLMQKEQVQQELEQEQTYMVGNTTFIVEPKFRADSQETVGSVLLKLMQNEIDNT